MKKLFIALCCAIFFSSIFAQRAPYSYVVLLKDKDTSTYSLSNPNKFLSEKAVAKRRHFRLPIQYMDVPVNAAYLDTLSHLDSSVQLLTASKWFNYAVVATYDSAGIRKELLERISSFPWVSGLYATHQVPDSLFTACFQEVCRTEAVEAAETVGRRTERRARPASLETDSLPDEYWGLSALQLKALNGLYLHRNQYRGEQMLVAVIDNGFLYADSLHYFQSLRDRNGIACAVDKSCQHACLYRNTGSHGMMVLSIMAINEPYEYVGSAPEATYLLIRTERDDYEDILEEYFWVAGAEYADSMGADVVNSSLGYTVFNWNEQNHLWTHLDGKHSFASIAAEKLCRTAVVNVAAGNEGDKVWRYFGIPSDAPSLLCVAAMSADSIVAPFSSRGDSIWIKPDIISVGWLCAYCGTDDTICFGNGTSFATPLNAGLTACLWQAFPDKTAGQVMQAVRKSSHLYPLHDSLYGYGIPDYEKAFTILKNSTETDEVPLLSFRIYPNPARDACWIESEGGVACLYDSKGQILRSLNLDSPRTFFSVKDLSAGIYFIRVCRDGCTGVQKLEVVR